MDHSVESVGVGSFTMSQARWKVHEPLHSFSLHNLSAVARVRTNVENNGFHAEEVGIQVFCFCIICLWRFRVAQIVLKKRKTGVKQSCFQVELLVFVLYQDDNSLYFNNHRYDFFLYSVGF